LFFEEAIITENYPNPLTQFIALLGETELDCWFQEDLARDHTAKTKTAFFAKLLR
jgi:hypothetical protein